MRPRNTKELIGYVIDRLGEGDFLNTYAVFDGLPNALVVEEDVYKIITLRKDMLEPVAAVLPDALDWWRP